MATEVDQNEPQSLLIAASTGPSPIKSDTQLVSLESVRNTPEKTTPPLAKNFEKNLESQ